MNCINFSKQMPGRQLMLDDSRQTHVDLYSCSSQWCLTCKKNHSIVSLSCSLLLYFLFGICCWFCFRFPGVFHLHSLFIRSSGMSVLGFMKYPLYHYEHFVRISNDVGMVFHIKYKMPHIYRFHFIFQN